MGRQSGNMSQNREIRQTNHLIMIWKKTVGRNVRGNVQILPVFSIIYMIRIRFFETRES